MTGSPLYLIDDEEPIRRSLGLVLKLAGHEVTAYATGAAFLGEVDALPMGCILLDIRMPEMNGLEVQHELVRRGIAMPIVMMTGHGDVATAVSALQAGADDFIEKPFERATILDAIEHACLRTHDPRAYRNMVTQAAQALRALSDRELAALEAFARGASNQAAASALGVDVAAIESGRAATMEKLGVAGLADAVRILYLARRTV